MFASLIPKEHDVKKQSEEKLDERINKQTHTTKTQ
jgi:hypothetical protein